jgi:hypothetical protein
MRTKLDEIVDDEYRPGSMTEEWERAPWRQSCKRIAERAFRHGVEQSKEAYWVMFQAGGDLGVIQPAPASEPEKWCKDRRKGERRKHTIQTTGWIYTRDGIERNGGIYHEKDTQWRWDRRSDSDRRKGKP